MPNRQMEFYSLNDSNDAIINQKWGSKEMKRYIKMN